MQVADEIRAEMARRKITVRELSAMTGLHRSTLSRILGAVQQVRLTEAEAISQALGVSLSELIRRAEKAAAKEAA